MKLSEWLTVYQHFSGKLSDINRQLAFAGIALVWLFRTDVKPIPNVPAGLLLPVILLIAGLATDLLHYTYGTVVWGCFHECHELRLFRAGVDRDVNVAAPAWLNWPSIVLFAAKVSAVAAAYAFIFCFVWSAWYPKP